VRVLAVVLLTPLLAAIALAVSHESVSSSPPAVKAKPQALVWADRVFTEPGPFAAWLRSRDHSYTVWARRHQRAALVLSQ
jgi:hypothetical protein